MAIHKLKLIYFFHKYELEMKAGDKVSRETLREIANRVIDKNKLVFDRLAEI